MAYMASLVQCACTPLPMPIYFLGDNAGAAESGRKRRRESSTRISARESVLQALGKSGDSAPHGRWFS
jgi:hypothetical protein